MVAMQTISASRPSPRLGSIVSGTLVGATMVAAGLGFGFLVIETPLVSQLVPDSQGSVKLAAAVFIWVMALVVGAGLSIAGTNRLAATMAVVRTGRAGRAPVTRMRSRLPADIVAAIGVVPDDGHPIPELVVGPFGIAVVHELGPRDIIRQVGSGWERRTSRGWVPTEYPVDRVNRDAERIRHWLTSGDMDFVVRVYAALVTTDERIPRSPTCAVISADQIPAWFEALPPQRSMTAGRRARLLERIRAATPGRH
jgi:hypothetical protein